MSNSRDFYKGIFFHVIPVRIIDPWFIVVVWVAACDVINFEIFLGFLIKPFSNISKNVRAKCKYLKNENSF